MVRRQVPVLCSALALTACQAAIPVSDETVSGGMTPPEYVACAQVRAELSDADAVARRFSGTNVTAEATYWRARQERLIARAYECPR
ncbi:hypothetical protein SAMN05444722_1116 [Rhodovulum sp. ES.010]|uniref:hypothetical protein n=1 Tax=Rhodovulum sp. ES.010 TaxID=1882821 RepID=UPI00092AF2CC|nr:hypothetical protein [Rhodovulum sp. ES.010]SIO27015.1 hypothetical protein SAMN05444722_1116 [Rhodovulum sp. ES.010]